MAGIKTRYTSQHNGQVGWLFFSGKIVGPDEFRGRQLSVRCRSFLVFLFLYSVQTFPDAARRGRSGAVLRSRCQSANGSVRERDDGRGLPVSRFHHEPINAYAARAETQHTGHHYNGHCSVSLSGCLRLP